MDSARNEGFYTPSMLLGGPAEPGGYSPESGYREAAVTYPEAEPDVYQGFGETLAAGRVKVGFAAGEDWNTRAAKLLHAYNEECTAVMEMPSALGRCDVNGDGIPELLLRPEGGNRGSDIQVYDLTGESPVLLYDIFVGNGGADSVFCKRVSFGGTAASSSQGVAFESLSEGLYDRFRITAYYETGARRSWTVEEDLTMDDSAAVTGWSVSASADVGGWQGAVVERSKAAVSDVSRCPAVDSIPGIWDGACAAAEDADGQTLYAALRALPRSAEPSFVLKDCPLRGEESIEKLRAVLEALVS